MKKLVLFAGLVVAATSIFAANEAGTYLVGAGLGYYDYANNWNLINDRPTQFLVGGYNFTDTWGVRYQVSRIMTHSKSTGQGMNGWLQTVNGVYNFATTSALHPYASFGMGLTRTNGYTNDANFVNFNAGIGAQYFISRNIAFDLQAQDLYTNSKTANDLYFSFGMDYEFGVPSDNLAQVPPVVQPVVQNSHHEVAPPDAHDKPLALFKLNSAKVNEAGKANIAELANKLKAQPNARVRLDGFADDTGTFEFNKYLSTKRSQSVAYYLQKDGISAMRIDTYGYGNAYPLSSNESEAGRAMNRRVAAMIIND